MFEIEMTSKAGELVSVNARDVRRIEEQNKHLGQGPARTGASKGATPLETSEHKKLGPLCAVIMADGSRVLVKGTLKAIESAVRKGSGGA